MACDLMNRKLTTRELHDQVWCLTLHMTKPIYTIGIHHRFSQGLETLNTGGEVP